MSEPKTPKRRQILVDPELQIGISTRVIGWIYIYFLAFSVLANSPAILAIVSSDARDAASIAAVDQIRGFARYVVLPLGLTFVAMAVHGVWITHRFAGPIVRFKRTMRDIAVHRLPAPITLRKKDYMKDLADEMNSAIAALREDAVRRKRLSEDHLSVVRDLVDTLETCPDNLSGALTRAYAVLDGAHRLDRQLEAPDSATPTGSLPLATAEQARASVVLADDSPDAVVATLSCAVAPTVTPTAVADAPSAKNS